MRMRVRMKGASNMSTNKRLSVFLKLFAAALPMCGAALLLIGFEHMPENAVMYARQDFVSAEEESRVTAADSPDNAAKYKRDAQYEAFGEVPVENYLEYMLKAVNGKIYVTDINGNFLYRIKTDTSSLPDADAKLLEAGMKVTGRELKEFVAYLES